MMKNSLGIELEIAAMTLAPSDNPVFTFILLPCIPVVITPFVILGVSFILSKSKIIVNVSCSHQLAFQGFIAQQTFVLDLSQFLLHVTDVKKS